MVFLIFQWSQFFMAFLRHKLSIFLNIFFIRPVICSSRSLTLLDTWQKFDVP